MKNNILYDKNTVKLLLVLIIYLGVFNSCKDDQEDPSPVASDNLALDSITTTKRSIVVWEEILITAHTRGENIKYQWSTNHGSMASQDSITVKYWACPSCLGLNTVECKVTNEYGTISDTIMIQVNQ